MEDELFSMVTNNNVEAVARVLAKSRVIAYDLETTGVDAHGCEILLYIFRGETGPAYIAMWNVKVDAILDVLTDRIVLAHNAPFEYMFTKLRTARVLTKFFDTQLAEGLLTNGLVMGDRRASLAQVTQRYIGKVRDKGEQKGFARETRESFVPTWEQLTYAAEDVLYLHDIMHCQLEKLRKENLLRVARLEFNYVPVIGDMMLNGFYLNLDRHAEVLARYVAEEAEKRVLVLDTLDALYAAYWEREAAQRRIMHDFLTKSIDETLAKAGVKRLSKDSPQELRDEVGALRKERAKFVVKKRETINLQSSEQVWNALAEAGIKLYKEEYNDKTGRYEDKPTLDKNVVQQNLHKSPVLAVYAEWAKANKVVTTYGETLRGQVHPLTGRVHAGYNQMINSGRLSSNNPNQQNMPPSVRQCFEAEGDNILIVADAKNQEGRLAAALSGDKKLLSVFLEGVDWHSLTAASAWPDLYPTWQDVPKESKERARAKNGNFSSIFGGTGKTLYAKGYVDDEATGNRIMKAIADTYTELAEWTGRNAQQAVTKGWVATISGRKRYFKLEPRPEGDFRNVEYRNWKKGQGAIRRAAMNHPIQGSGADIMKQAMILLREPMEALGFKACTFVHDEVVYEGPESRAQEAAQLVADKMLEAAACFIKVLPIPGDVKVTKVWAK